MQLEALIRAIVDTMIDGFHPAAAGHDRRRALEHVLATLARMPAHLRLGVRIVLFAFAASVLVRHARPFARLGAAERAARLRSWRAPWLPAAPGVFTFLHRMALFGLYSAVYHDASDVHVRAA